MQGICHDLTVNTDPFACGRCGLERARLRPPAIRILERATPTPGSPAPEHKKKKTPTGAPLAAGTLVAGEPTAALSAAPPDMVSPTSRPFHAHLLPLLRIALRLTLLPLSRARARSQFSIAAINESDSGGQWEPLAPTKEAQVGLLILPAVEQIVL
ncbi:hypothetical protein HU200_045276 [Digitaria exilis]|uniref:Uncharacterized protein n=1 Tax=Digitaria exilis TaxID=1010633 RepID=A0A835AXW0_9POAL|nr:hypothetical protein HU200_045276 [Digitaria exilis]